MADMELVIKIPHYVYITVVETGKLFSYHLNAARAIKDGIVLPKGHGRLIDADVLYEAHKRYWRGEEIIDLRNAPTIIEADNSESKEKDDIEAMLDHLWKCY